MTDVTKITTHAARLANKRQVAEFFAVCDDPMAGCTTDTTSRTDSLEREGKERECVETHKLSTTGTTGATPETSRG